MSDIVFLALLALYIWYSAKVDEWVTISSLGFSLEAPQGFLENPSRYNHIGLIILAACIASLLAVDRIPWYAGLLLVAVAWFATTAIGQRRAFDTYRRRCNEALQEETSAEKKEFFEAESKKSNTDIRDLLISRIKAGL